MSSVASGRQAKRTGAYGEVPSPAETCSQAASAGACDDDGAPGRRRATSGQALGPAAVEVAVGHQRAVAGQAQLAAVGVPGDDQRGAVGGHRVEHPLVRRVQ